MAGKVRRMEPATRSAAFSSELVDLIGRHSDRDGVQDTAIGALHLYRSRTRSEPVHTVYRPSLCIVAQGRKSVSFGTETMTYGPRDFLLVAVNVPVIAQLFEASPEQPHLALHVDVDVSIVASLIAEAGQGRADEGTPQPGLSVGALEDRVRDVILRLVRLLDEPRDIPVLAPLIVRELSHRLLAGPSGDALRRMAMSAGPTRRIAKAIERIEVDYRESLRVHDLAREVSMSVSGFHRHFKAVTAMTPVQFQKRLRLQEARRLLVGGQVNVTTAGFEVGYESASHFTRDYRVLFGASPSQDLSRLS